MCIIFSLVAYLPLGSDSSKGAPSPSVLFAHRLMHFCSAEVVAQAINPTVSFHDVPVIKDDILFLSGAGLANTLESSGRPE